ncbi:hypothetical protein GRJ2_001879200 [Grus japonensis]|uniref:Uncharacterized protein n=1 Tax=Grus japonensis TaxID=30415 RepID=A0ABC9XAR7_GRUJA
MESERREASRLLDRARPLTPDGESGGGSAVWVSVKRTTDFCSTLQSKGTVARHGDTAKHSCLAIRINYNPGIRTVNALELPRQELAVCQHLNEDVSSHQDSLGAGGNTQ